MKMDYRDIDFARLPEFVQVQINEILLREGGTFTNHPNDHPTKWGIRRLSADRAGYTGKIEDLTRREAAQIWTSLFWYAPNMHMIASISPLVARTVLDTSGPAGLRRGITHLQEALVSFNRLVRGAHVYGPDLKLDGIIGRKTSMMLIDYLLDRLDMDGERVLASRLNCLQDAHYTKLAVADVGKRDFSFGWSSKRVFADLMDLALATENTTQSQNIVKT